MRAGRAAAIEREWWRMSERGRDMDRYILRRAEGNRGPFHSVSMLLFLGSFALPRAAREVCENRRAPPRRLSGTLEPTARGSRVCTYHYHSGI